MCYFRFDGIARWIAFFSQSSSSTFDACACAWDEINKCTYCCKSISTPTSLLPKLQAEPQHDKRQDTVLHFIVCFLTATMDNDDGLWNPSYS